MTHDAAPEAPTVLLVDDDDAFATLLCDHLERRGRSVRRSSTLAGAARALRDDPPPALIVLDLNLPDGAGWSLLRDPAYASAGAPPVVVVSAVTVHPARLAEAGVAGYLPKPFPLPTFMAVLERYLPEEPR